jgi:hypothetical protein
MPFLPDEHSTDKLLKNLGIDLSQQRFGPMEMRKFGWFQYRDHDHIKTLVSTELAADAFLYLGFDEDGAWRRNPKVLTAILAFMERYFQVRPRQEDFLRLKELIDTKPLNSQAITEWFHAMYPPDHAPTKDFDA